MEAIMILTILLDLSRSSRQHRETFVRYPGRVVARSFVVSLGLLLAVLLSCEPLLAADMLLVTFDDPSQPFIDHSSAVHTVNRGVFSEGGRTGTGVQWSDNSPRSPAGGGYAVFDGGSFLEVEPTEDLVFSAGEDFTIRFWFRSPGIDRGPAYGVYRNRMEVMGFGRIPNNATGTNLDADFDDPDASGQGHWTYWTGGGHRSIRSGAGTVGRYTDNRWYHYWLVRESGRLTLYIGDTNSTYTRLGSFVDDTTIGSSTGPNYFGRAPATFLRPFGWLGAIDEIQIMDVALHPTDTDGDGVLDEKDLCPNTNLPEVSVPSDGLNPNHYADTDGDGVFNVGAPRGRGRSAADVYTLQDTGGCSCEQIIVALRLGEGHRRHGCSVGVLSEWFDQISD